MIELYIIKADQSKYSQIIMWRMNIMYATAFLLSSGSQWRTNNRSRSLLSNVVINLIGMFCNPENFSVFFYNFFRSHWRSILIFIHLWNQSKRNWSSELIFHQNIHLNWVSVGPEQLNYSRIRMCYVVYNRAAIKMKNERKSNHYFNHGYCETYQRRNLEIAEREIALTGSVIDAHTENFRFNFSTSYSGLEQKFDYPKNGMNLWVLFQIRYEFWAFECIATPFQREI